MWIIFNILKFIFLLVLPFALLIRTATYIHVEYEVGAMMCLLYAALATAVVMFIYFSFFYGRFTGKLGDFDALKRRGLIAFLVVVVYCMHGILFMSSSNLKSTSLEREIRSLHPIVRLSVSTLVYLDKDLIITDAARVPEDYRAMGLPAKNTSLHYKQPSTNYAHAIDIRTRGRSEVKNGLIKMYFQLMGFNTLRHGGTGDHLHVSLRSHDFPHAK